MDRETIIYGTILHRFLDRFQSIQHHRVPLCKYLYYPFLYYAMNKKHLIQALEKTGDFQNEITQFSPTAIYKWSDEPYAYDPHPNGVVLMRGGFGDIASLFLPKERFVLLSPNQAEVDLIKLNRPDLTAHNIETFYHPNLPAVESCRNQIKTLIEKNKNDPLFGSEDFLQWFQSQIPGAIQVLDAVQSIFETGNIGMALTISSIVWMDSALNLIAKANHIPSVTLQHGLILERDLFCHIPIIATKKMVWGKAIQQWYQKHGYPESRVSVVGSPRFDVIFNRKWCGKERLCQMLGIAPGKRIAVYATGTDKETIVPIVVKGLENIQELFLIILLHPSESALVSQYQELAGNSPFCKVVQFGHITLYDALSGADFFITHCSTAGLEAMFFKLPVITVEPSPPPFSYGSLGASIPVTNSAELHQTANRLINDEAYRSSAISQYQQFLSEYCIPDGSASKRLFEEVEKLCQTGGIT